MSLIIQKFGGTSLATVDRIKEVAHHIKSVHSEGNQIVVVVSAMGKETNRLKSLAFELTESPSAREMDVLLTAGERVSMSLLSIALTDIGIHCQSLTGSQSGILTDEHHGHARIQKILGDRIQDGLKEDKVVIVAGFQGMTIPSKDISTLGRGGSDLTAVALAYRLKADLCEIFTDVEGVFDRDPRKFENARIFKEIDFDDLKRLAWNGAGVIHSRAAQLAAKHDIKMQIRSSFEWNHPGTTVRRLKEKGRKMERAKVLAITTQEGMSFVEIELDGKKSIAEYHEQLNEMSWSKGLIADCQTFHKKGDNICASFICDQRAVDELHKAVQKDCSRPPNILQTITGINVVGDGFFQDNELTSDILKTIGEQVLHFEKNNEVLKIFVPNEKGRSLTSDLQKKYLCE